MCVIKKGPTAAGLVSDVWAMKEHAMCQAFLSVVWTLVKPYDKSLDTLLSRAAHSSGGLTAVLSSHITESDECASLKRGLLQQVWSVVFGQ